MKNGVRMVAFAASLEANLLKINDFGVAMWHYLYISSINEPQGLTEVAKRRKYKQQPKKQPRQQAEVQKTRSKKNISLALIPAVFGFLLYINTLGHGYVLDDGLVILKHSHVQKGLAGLPDIFTTNFLNGVDNFNDGLYRPLVLFTFAFEQQFFGSVGTSHFINILLYALTGLLLFMLLKQLFVGRHVLFPLFITMLFMAHPVHTEAVANLKGRDEMLAFLNMVLMALFMVKYVKTDQLKHLLLGLLFFALAFFSKESAITMVVGIPVLLYFFTEVPAKKLGIVFASMVVMAAALYGWHHHVITSMSQPMDEGIVSALNNSILSTDDMTERIATGLFMQLLYIWKLVLPMDLVHDYSYNQVPVIGMGSIKALGAVALLGLLAFFVFRGLKKKDGIAFGIIFFFVTIITVANILVYIGATFAERFLYTPSLGFAIVFGLLLLKLVKLPAKDKQPEIRQVLNNNKLFTFLAGAVLLSYSFKTVNRNGDWKDNLTLFAADVSNISNSARAHYNYGTELYALALAQPDDNAKKQFAAQATQQLVRAVTIFPEYLDAWNNLGNSYQAAGKPDSAVFSFQQALIIDPAYSKAYYNIGMAYFQKNDFPNTITALSRYVQFVPNADKAYYTMGIASGNMKKYAQSVAYLQKAMEVNPQNVQAMKDLGAVYGMKGNLQKSLEVSLKASELDPNDPNLLRNIAISYRHFGNEQMFNEYNQRAQQVEARNAQ